ncbi:MAG: hypothetical protein ABIG96_06025, partial [Candidatus Micrarchaeota archaeon]
FDEKIKGNYLGLENALRIMIAKKMEQMEREGLVSRHLKFGKPFFVEEIGQYRLCFKIDEKMKVKTIIFIGDHKEYERWAKI